MNSIPLASHSAISSSRIDRDASWTSLSPAQKRAKPSLVPGPSTVIWTDGSCAANFSAFAAEIGSTVDEPETKRDVPPPGDASPEPPPHAARTRIAASARPGDGRRHLAETFNVLLRVRGPRTELSHGRGSRLEARWVRL